SAWALMSSSVMSATGPSVAVKLPSATEERISIASLTSSVRASWMIWAESLASAWPEEASLPPQPTRAKRASEAAAAAVKSFFIFIEGQFLSYILKSVLCGVCSQDGPQRPCLCVLSGAVICYTNDTRLKLRPSPQKRGKFSRAIRTLQSLQFLQFYKTIPHPGQGKGVCKL